MSLSALVQDIPDEAFQTRVILFTLKKLDLSLSILDKIIRSHSDNDSLQKTCLDLVKKIVSIRVNYELIQTVLSNSDNQISIKHLCFVSDPSPELRFNKSNFHFENFKETDNFLHGYILDKLELNLFESDKTWSWEKRSSDFFYVERALVFFNSLQLIGIFPVEEVVRLTKSQIRKTSPKFIKKMSVGKSVAIRKMTSEITKRMLAFFNLIGASKSSRLSPSYIAQLLFEEQNLLGVVHLFETQPTNLSLNFIESNPIIRKSIRNLLPQIRTVISLFTETSDEILTSEIYSDFEARNFEISTLNGSHISTNPLRFRDQIGKLTSSTKDNFLKIKLIHDYKIDPNATDVSEMLPFDSSVVIFCTGGGYMADCEKFNQFYLREMSKTLGKPVFIIKYRLAPSHKFPAAVNDVINGYLSILLTFGDKIKDITLMGDSAGGSLICSLTLFTILARLRIPDKLIMIYPGLSCSRRFFSSSLLKTFEDILLNFSFLDTVLRAYIPEGMKGENIFLSPLHAPKHLLQNFPLTYTISGREDPLYDQSLYFCYLLYSIGVS